MCLTYEGLQIMISNYLYLGSGIIIINYNAEKNVLINLNLVYRSFITIFLQLFFLKISWIICVNPGINAYSEDSCLGLPPLCRRCTVDCKSRLLFFFILRGFALPLDKSLSSSDDPLELDLTPAFSGLKEKRSWAMSYNL